MNILDCLRLEVEPFSKVRIGDPYYFEQLSKKGLLGNEMNRVCFTNLYGSDRKACIVIRNLLDKNYLFMFSFKDSIKDELIISHLNGTIVSEDLRWKKLLDSPSEKFELRVDDKEVTILNQSNDVYGYCYQYLSDDCVFEIKLDADEVDISRLKKIVSYLFQV